MFDATYKSSFTLIDRRNNAFQVGPLQKYHYDVG